MCRYAKNIGQRNIIHIIGHFMERECVQCLKFKHESTTQYAKRIKKSFNYPFYCQACRKYPIPFEEILFKRELPKIIEERKKEIRTIISRYKKDKELSLASEKTRNEQKEKRKLYRQEYLKSEIGKENQKKGWIKRKLTLKKALIGIPKYEIKLVKEFYENRPLGYEIDHIIPISKGGKHSIDNLRYIKNEDHKHKFNKIDPRYIEYALENENISILSLMRKFKLEREYAEKIFIEIKYWI